MSFLKKLFGSQSDSSQQTDRNAAQGEFLVNLLWQGSYSGDAGVLGRESQAAVMDFRAKHPGVMTKPSSCDGSKQPDGSYDLVITFPAVRARNQQHGQEMMADLEEILSKRGFSQR